MHALSTSLLWLLLYYWLENSTIWVNFAPLIPWLHFCSELNLRNENSHLTLNSPFKLLTENYKLAFNDSWQPWQLSYFIYLLVLFYPFLKPQTPFFPLLFLVFYSLRKSSLRIEIANSHYHTSSLCGICAHVLCIPAVHIEEQTVILSKAVPSICLPDSITSHKHREILQQSLLSTLSL